MSVAFLNKILFTFYKSPPHSFTPFTQGEKEKEATLRVIEAIKPYFLSPYRLGSPSNCAEKWIRGIRYKVERFNHGLAHGIRQGALAKDIFELLIQMNREGISFKETEGNKLLDWAFKKSRDPLFLKKIELASSFQRSGREQEGGSSDIPELYKKFELQDTVYFRKAAFQSGLFTDPMEILIFQEAILWSNKGTLNEKELEDLKYLRRILHAAHTLDLRRINGFDPVRIRNDAKEQLFGSGLDFSKDPLYKKAIDILWDRSGAYLEATGDRDVVSQRGLQNRFFLQTKNPDQMASAIDRIRKQTLNPVGSKF